MLETILKLYRMAMATGTRSPLPHLFGPPGCGKSSVVQEAADIIGVRMHTVNVSRISPLDLEGVQMPTTRDTGEQLLKMLHATYWTDLQPGDILLFDEFLRGFPEVYNGLLDILTSREVAGMILPDVFMLGASNSTVSYDKALEDRLLHLPVPDPRKNAAVKKALAERLVNTLGLLPQVATSLEVNSLLDTEVLPMYEVLDSLKNKTSSPAQLKGHSLRNLIGQAQLRQIETPGLKDVIKVNNSLAMSSGKPQYVFLTDGKAQSTPAHYEEKARALVGNDRLTEIQALNLRLNLELIELERIRHERGTPVDDRSSDDDELIFG